MIFFFVKKKGRRLIAYLCLFIFFWSVFRIRCIFFGVIYVRITFFVIGILTALFTVLLELMVLARVVGVGLVGVFIVGIAGVFSVGIVDVFIVGILEVFSVGIVDVFSVGIVGVVGVGKCIERLVFILAFKFSKVFMLIVDRL